MHQQPQGAAFDLVLLLHAGCVVVGLATTVAAVATAGKLRRVLGSAAPVPEALRRYFRPGVNWAGRTVYGIPVFGFALIALSDGAYSLSDGWVVAGIVVFVVLALVAEVTLWPAERRVQAALAAPGPGAGPADAGATTAADAATMARSAWVVLALLVAGTVVMIAQP